ncbi:MAG: type II 3-dehydroquinate dehydratase [Hyphomicrobiales bacterium]|nr:type II 3-dehydroquinate dehydratase [Hyphomicrobiales bacterium]
MSVKPVFILNGPNLNLLGRREPEIYGRATLDDVKALCVAKAAALGLIVDFRQSNHEGALIDWTHEAREAASGLVMNAGAYTHTSIGLLDALLACPIPCVEVHLSNIYKREDFRHFSFVSKAAWGVICGFGPKGYELALDALAGELLGPNRPSVS